MKLEEEKIRKLKRKRLSIEASSPNSSISLVENAPSKRARTTTSLVASLVDKKRKRIQLQEPCKKKKKKIWPSLAYDSRLWKGRQQLMILLQVI